MAPSLRIEGERAGAPTFLRRAVLAFAILAAPFAASTAAGGDEDLRFQRHGEAVATKSRTALEALSRPRAVRVFEPYELRPVAFEAISLPKLLDAVYGPSWRKEEEILFTCRDGYQPTVPVKRVLDHDAWLAFAREDQDAFAIQKKESGELKTIELGPYYVVWENLEDERIRLESDYGWPYQVVAIDLIDSRARFPAIAPPEGASDSVLRGFDAYRIHCSKCHRLNGEGGTIGPELNPAPGSGDYYERSFLRTWIEEPDRVRKGTRMPPLNPSLPNRAKVVDDIIDYLFAMARGNPPKAEH